MFYAMQGFTIWEILVDAIKTTIRNGMAFVIPTSVPRRSRLDHPEVRRLKEDACPVAAL